MTHYCEKWRELVEWDDGIIPEKDGTINSVADSDGPRNWDYDNGKKRDRLKFIYCPYCSMKLND